MLMCIGFIRRLAPIALPSVLAVVLTGCGTDASRSQVPSAPEDGGYRCEYGYFTNDGQSADLAVIFREGWNDATVQDFIDAYLKVPSAPPKTGHHPPMGVGAMATDVGVIFLALCRNQDSQSRRSVEALIRRMRQDPSVAEIRRNVDMRSVNGYPEGPG